MAKYALRSSKSEVGPFIISRLISMYYVYLIKSLKKSQKIYIGYTTNLKEQILKHNEGGSKYTLTYRPWKLITYLAFSDKYKALILFLYLCFCKKRV